MEQRFDLMFLAPRQAINKPDLITAHRGRGGAGPVSRKAQGSARFIGLLNLTLPFSPSPTQLAQGGMVQVLGLKKAQESRRGLWPNEWRFSCEGAERLRAKRPRQLQTLVGPQVIAERLIENCRNPEIGYLFDTLGSKRPGWSGPAPPPRRGIIVRPEGKPGQCLPPSEDGVLDAQLDVPAPRVCRRGDFPIVPLMRRPERVWDGARCKPASPR